MPATESTIVAKAEHNPQEQALLLTEDKGHNMERNAELSDEALSAERILLQLQLNDKNKIERSKKDHEVIKKSKCVIINLNHEELTGPKALIFFV